MDFISEADERALREKLVATIEEEEKQKTEESALLENKENVKTSE